MTAAERTARTLGGVVRSAGWWRCRCPVHGSRSATLALRDGERGLIVKCWAGCDPLDVLAELRRMRLLNGGTDPAPSRAGTIPPKLDDGGAARRVDRARRLWEATSDARGSPVVSYLAGRGITIDPPPSLRWVRRCAHPTGTIWLAMVAAIVDLSGALIGVSRTYLKPDGSSKAPIDPPKAMLGRAARGAVRLGEAAATLLIAEGIETGLAVTQATAMPVWATLGTAGMAALALPKIVRHVVIVADNDPNGAGERAANAAAQRWLGEGRSVRIVMPPSPGDFNDVLLTGGSLRAA